MLYNRNMEQTAYIYVLRDPRTDEIRYVGKTGNLRKRFPRHLREAKKGTKWHVSNWIRLLVSLELKPVMQVIEECTKEGWTERETYWIAYGRQVDWRLTNHTDGGEGISGWNHTEETRFKLSESQKGNKHTDERRRNESEAQKGNKNSLGYKHTDEHNRKIGEAKRGEKAPAAKLTESDVHEIGQMIQSGKKDKEIADLYGVAQETISSIRHGRSWGWLYAKS